jgi:hypothetical protein
MQARTAYISSLGTTGLLIASSLLLSLALGVLLTFDGWPTHGDSHAQEVTVRPAARPAAPHARSDRLARGAAVASRALGRAASPRSRRDASAPSPRTGSPDGGAVVSTLPAPAVGPRHLNPGPAQSGQGTRVVATNSHPASRGGPLPLPGMVQVVVPPAAVPPAADATLDDAHRRVVGALASTGAG